MSDSLAGTSGAARRSAGTATREAMVKSQSHRAAGGFAAVVAAVVVAVVAAVVVAAAVAVALGVMVVQGCEIICFTIKELAVGP